MVYMGTAVSVAALPANRYVPRGRNELHTIFERHFADFCEQYDENFAATYGMYHLECIQEIGERFSTCGDYLQGVVRLCSEIIFPIIYISITGVDDSAACGIFLVDVLLQAVLRSCNHDCRCPPAGSFRMPQSPGNGTGAC